MDKVFLNHLMEHGEQYNKKMRRNTLLPHKTPLELTKSRRHRTMIQTDFSLLSQPQQHQSLKTHFMHSESIIRQFIEDTLMNRIEEEMNKRQLKKIVNQTMNQCIKLFQNQNWQIDPNGPFTQRQKQPQIKLEDQPQIVRFDSILGFDKNKKYKLAKVQTQTSLQLSRVKMTSPQNYLKPKPFKPGSRKSIINTHRTISSKLNSNMIKDFPKLVPLKLENCPNTPQGSYRRNLQDFLREKKINAEINLGYKMKYFDEKQNHALKTIQEFPKSSFLLYPFKNQDPLGQKSIKLPLISVKQEAGMDYDGGLIPLKKVTKKSKEILKTVCKVKNSTDQIKKPINSKNRVEKIKIRAPTIRKDSANLLSLSARNSVQEDLKSVIEQTLHTNRVRFREIDQNQPTPVYDLPT